MSNYFVISVHNVLNYVAFVQDGSELCLTSLNMASAVLNRNFPLFIN